jgi:hypothetical protein
LGEHLINSHLNQWVGISEKIRVGSQASQCRICGRRRGITASFSPNTFRLPLSVSVSQQSLLMFHSSTIEPIRRILAIPKSLSKTLVCILNMLACCDTCRSNVGTKCDFRNTFRSVYHTKKIHEP